MDATEVIVVATLLKSPNSVRHANIVFLLGGAYAGVIPFLFNSAILLDLLRPLMLKSKGFGIEDGLLISESSSSCDWEMLLLVE